MKLAIELPPEVEERLTVLAAKIGRTPAECVRAAIFRYIEDIEDLETARERLADRDERTWTLEEVEKGLDLGPCRPGA